MRDSSDGKMPKLDSAQPLGIIDTLGFAFASLNRRPYLVWLPVLLDVLLWSRVRITLVDPASWVTNEVRTIPGELGGIADEVHEILSGIDVITIVSMLVPTLNGAYGREAVASPSTGSSVLVSGAIDGLVLVLATVAALLVGMTYLTLVGRLVADQPAWGRRFIVDSLRTTARGMLLVMAVSALFAFMFLPVAATGLVLSLLGIDPAIVLLLVAGILAFWLGMHFLFGIPALAMGQTSVPMALRFSYQVVNRNFLAVLGLLLIVLMIRTGAPYALQVFADSEWSVPFAIVVHAYIATGLIAALMLFFHQRVNELTIAHVDERTRTSEQ